MSILAGFRTICDAILKKTPLSSMRQGRFDVSVSRHKRMKRQPPITGKADDNKKDCEKNFALYIVSGMVPVALQCNRHRSGKRAMRSSRRSAILNNQTNVSNKRANVFQRKNSPK